MNAIRTILHPTDFSNTADAAFRMACSLAEAQGARLVVLHAVPPPYPILGELVPPAAADPWCNEENLEPLRRRLGAMKPANSDIEFEVRLEVGEPVEVILQTATDVGADVVVIGTHGRTGIKRFVMGSVAEQIVRRAECAVLTVKLAAAVGTQSPRETAAAAG